MDKQVFVGNEAPRDTFHPVRNIERTKHEGGLWTSTYNEETGESDWLYILRDWPSKNPDALSWYLITPSTEARIAFIDDEEDIARYSHYLKNGRFDFERLAQDFDAFSISSYAAAKFRNGILNGWDIESTIWFRSCFTSVERIH